MFMNHKALALCAALAAGVLPGVAHANLISNGNFSSACGSSFCTYNGGDSTSITGWTVGGSSVDVINTYWQAPPGGGSSVDLDGLGAGSIATSFGTTNGTEYTLSFELSGNPDGGDPIKTVEVDVGGVTQIFTFDTSAAGNTLSDMKWVLETLTFTASGTITNLKFLSLDASGSDYGAVIGNVEVVPVPEPGTLALFGAGLLVMGVYARRKTRGAS
jgi:choice-of-anchor C domain-containing protein